MPKTLLTTKFTSAKLLQKKKVTLSGKGRLSLDVGVILLIICTKEYFKEINYKQTKRNPNNKIDQLARRVQSNINKTE